MPIFLGGGRYEWKLVCKFLPNAVDSMQRCVDRVASAAPALPAVAMVDTLVVFSPSPYLHIRHVDAVLARLTAAELRLDSSQSLFGVKRAVAGALQTLHQRLPPLRCRWPLHPAGSDAQLCAAVGAPSAGGLLMG